MSELTEILSKNYVGVSLCSLHHPCNPNPNCNIVNSFPVFDFDQITKDYRKRKGLPSCASVDGLTESRTIIYFIEMKGWKEYLLRTPRISESKIQKQVNKYDLAHKLADSVDTCVGILCEVDAEKEDVFLSLPKCYVIVTDISPQQNPLDSIANNLNLLAQASSDWETVCWNHLKEKAHQVKGIKTLFVSCREFDSLFM